MRLLDDSLKKQKRKGEVHKKSCMSRAKEKRGVARAQTKKLDFDKGVVSANHKAIRDENGQGREPSDK